MWDHGLIYVPESGVQKLQHDCFEKLLHLYLYMVLLNGLITHSSTVLFVSYENFHCVRTSRTGRRCSAIQQPLEDLRPIHKAMGDKGFVAGTDSLWLKLPERV